MIEASVPAVYALQTATTNAQLLKKDKELGSITAGKSADITAVPGNPLNDIGVMSKASFVMKAGAVYKQDGKELFQASIYLLHDFSKCFWFGPFPAKQAGRPMAASRNPTPQTGSSTRFPNPAHPGNRRIMTGE